MTRKLNRHGDQALKRVIARAKQDGYGLTDGSMNGKNVVYATFHNSQTDDVIEMSFDCCNNRGVQIFERELKKRQNPVDPRASNNRRSGIKSIGQCTPA